MRLLGIGERNYELYQDYNIKKISIGRKFFHYISIFICVLGYLMIVPMLIMTIEISLNNKIQEIDDENERLFKLRQKQLLKEESRDL
jgi:hypothetical protein